MAQLEARKHISPDSGFPIIQHPNFNPKIKEHVPPEPIRAEISVDKDRARFADPEKKALYSVAKRVDLTESIGTVLENVQLSQFGGQQLDELAALVTERGVVFFRDQDLTTDGQVKLFQHYGTLLSPSRRLTEILTRLLGTLDRHPAQKVSSCSKTLSE